MDAVRADVERLVKKELLEANKKFPIFHSMHEGAAVIKEEIDEVEEVYIDISNLFDVIWGWIKKDKDPDMIKDGMSRLKKHAEHLAVEAIQTAAMAQKFIDSQAEEMRQKKIDSLKKQIRKLEGLRFE